MLVSLLCWHVAQYQFLHLLCFSRCTQLPREHSCRFLQNRGSNFTLPQLHSLDAVISDVNVQSSLELLTSLRDEYPDECIDVFEHIFCIFVAPPCDSMSNGLPMLFCEQHCVVYTMLKEEGVCNSTIEHIHDSAIKAQRNNLIQAVGILQKFDCNNVATYHYLKSDDYSQTCTALISEG